MVMLIEQIPLFGALCFEPDDWVELRTIDDTKSGGRSSCRHIQAKALISDETIQWTQDLNSGTCGIFIGPAPRRSNCGSGKNGFGTDKDVEFSRVLWADVDGYATRDQIDAEHDLYYRIGHAKLPSPNLIVWSGGGFHLYWV